MDVKRQDVAGTSVKEPLARRGCYTLVIRLGKTKRLRVGRRERSSFPEGIYLYTGSAMNGLKGRLSRHLRRQKKSRWHIDYLLQSPEATIKEVLTYPAVIGQECRQNQRIARLPGAKVILKGFGASDCTSGCGSHLLYFGGRLPAAEIDHDWKLARAAGSMHSSIKGVSEWPK